MFRSVDIIGAGNIAFHLAKVLLSSGTQQLRVFARNPEANVFPGLMHILSKTPDIFDMPAELSIIAVNDDSIRDVASRLSEKGQLVVHTSGSMEMNVLEKFQRRGVFYPLQTFSKKRAIMWKGVPLFVESSMSGDAELLKNLGLEISGSVQYAHSKERMKMHVAAVFVSNFVNYMFVQGRDLMNEQDLDFSMLHPLIRETVDKVFEMDPCDAQTGPARRNDRKTMGKHLHTLENKPEAKKIYELISEEIVKRNANEKL